ncbi:hypothetical protein CCE01nite_29410 [Cellulomonas cellasea]|uniref:Uncharacterized protein n=1 Tax=Cellulomonas cellasea TaxID=43670 RepID=A0A4Y3KY01_9CELL|nr:hypothetical protein CCE01nite_29410 [Cellulomonas cellasea]
MAAVLVLVPARGRCRVVVVVVVVLGPRRGGVVLGVRRAHDPALLDDLPVLIPWGGIRMQNAAGCGGIPPRLETSR